MVKLWTYFFKFFAANQLVIFPWLQMFLLWTSCVWNFLLEDTFVLLQDLLDKGILSNTWWSNDNEWFASQRSRVERMEVLFGVNVDIILFLNKNKNKFKLCFFFKYLLVCEGALMTGNHWALLWFLGAIGRILHGTQSAHLYGLKGIGVLHCQS